MWITPENRKWWILAAMTTSISMIFIDVTVMAVVQPTLQHELNFSELGLQWVINSYILVLAVLVLAGGKLGDMWGLKKAFCFGICFFAFASFLCGLSLTGWWLIFSRALQGIGGAFLIPATQGIIVSHFPPHQRGKAMGLFVSIGSIFLTVGPLIGGSLTTYLSWRYVFWINLPIALIGLVMTLITVPPMPGKKEKFDIRGFAILAIGVTSLIVALMQTQAWGWLSSRTLLLLAIGLFSLFFLFKRKHKPHASILDFDLMGKKFFIASSSCVFSVQFIVMVNLFWPVYFQNILGFSASLAGFYAFLSSAPVLFSAPIAGFLVDRHGPRLPAMIGFSLLAIALGWVLFFFRAENIWYLFPGLILFGFGVPMVFTPSFVAMMNHVPPEKRGNASGINAALRQFSSTLGYAIFGTVFSMVFLSDFSQSLRANPATASLDPESFEGLLSHATNAMQATTSLPATEVKFLFQAADASYLNAFFYINLLAALIGAFGILLAYKLLSNRAIHKEL